MEATKKFNDLVVGNTCVVLGCSDQYNSKYGINYILLLKDTATDEKINVWSTNLLAKYISNEKPDKKFTFQVGERDNKKYPIIDGYRTQIKFNMFD